MWTEIIDVANSDIFKGKEISIKDFVQSKLEEFQDITSSLADEEDQDKRTALSIASPEVREVFHDFMYFMGRYEFHIGPPVYKSATALIVQAIDHKLVKKVFNAKFNKFKNDEGFMTKDEFDDCFNSWDLVADALTYKSISSTRSQEKTYKSISSTRSQEKFDFYDCDLDKCGRVSKKEFEAYCSKIFGATRTVVLKFMKNEDQYRKEINARQTNNLNAKFVMNIISGPEEDSNEDIICKSIQVSNHKHLKRTQYKFMIVLPAADRNLLDVILKEKPNASQKMMLLKGVAQAIQHLHENRIIHGDIKALNVVIKDEKNEKTVQLIDLDASVNFDEYAGAKFSSGVLPPEMFAKLNAVEFKSFETYFTNIKRDELWVKVKPFYDISRKCYYAVRTFIDSKGIDGFLPGDDFLIKATPSIDIWSFGVLMYYMLSTNNEPLFAVDINDDISKRGCDEYRKMIEMTDNSIANNILEFITDPFAQELLMKILRRGPNDRISFTDILVTCAPPH
jgi:serine/threonine protein kinase